MYSSKKLLGLSFLVTINLLLQFLFQWYIIVAFGAGEQSDAFFGSMALPQFILLVLSGSLTLVLIPMLSNFNQDEFYSESWNYFYSISIIFTIIAILLFITSSWWVALILPGFKAETYVLALHLTQIQLVSMVFSAMLSVLWAIHSAKNNFYLIETTSILASIVSFGLLYLATNYFGIYSAAWVFVLRIFFQLLFLIRVLGPHKKPTFNSPTFKLTWKKIRPLIAGNLYYKTDSLVDRYLTSTGKIGELTLLNLAQQLLGAGNSILTKVLVNTMVPNLSKEHKANNIASFNSIFKKRLLICFAISTIIICALIFAGKPLLIFAFKFKNFDEESVNRLWWILILLSGYWVGGLLGAVTSSTFYAKSNTITPTRIGAINFTLYVPIKILCYYKYGIQGLAISISIYYILSFVIQLFYLRKHFN